LRGRGYDDVKDVWCKSFLIIPASTGVKGKAAGNRRLCCFYFSNLERTNLRSSSLMYGRRHFGKHKHDEEIAMSKALVLGAAALAFSAASALADGSAEPAPPVEGYAAPAPPPVYTAPRVYAAPVYTPTVVYTAPTVVYAAPPCQRLCLRVQ